MSVAAHQWLFKLDSTSQSRRSESSLENYIHLYSCTSSIHMHTMHATHQCYSYNCNTHSNWHSTSYSLVNLHPTPPWNQNGQTVRVAQIEPSNLAESERGESGTRSDRNIEVIFLLLRYPLGYSMTYDLWTLNKPFPFAGWAPDIQL